MCPEMPIGKIVLNQQIYDNTCRHYLSNADEEVSCSLIIVVSALFDIEMLVDEAGYQAHCNHNVQSENPEQLGKRERQRSFKIGYEPADHRSAIRLDRDRQNHLSLW